MIAPFRKIYYEFPHLFWIIVGARFIDGFGSTLLFPFFSLYITQKFGVGMTQAGVLLGMSSLFGLIGSMTGGALADKFGRRQLILFGLVSSALSSLMFGLANDIRMLYGLIVVVGLLSHVAMPAHEAMLVDILPEEKRQEGYGILRVVFNYAWIFGTAMGGFIAARSFLALFVIDAVISCIVAVIIYRLVPETKPQVHKDAPGQESLWETVKGYRVVLRDYVFIGYILAGMLALIIYQQQYGSFAVYLRDVHDIDSKGYGVILAVTGLEVVLFQFWISRMIRHQPPFLMMTLAAVVFAFGIFMYGFVSSFALFLLAAFIVCVGEMVYFPTHSVLVAGFAPADMRGRYMAVAGLVWSIPSTLGPGAAGYIIDHYNPHLLWYFGGFLCLISALGNFLLHFRFGTQPRFAVPPRETQEITT